MREGLAQSCQDLELGANGGILPPSFLLRFLLFLGLVSLYSTPLTYPRFWLLQFNPPCGSTMPPLWSLHLHHLQPTLFNNDSHIPIPPTTKLFRVPLRTL